MEKMNYSSVLSLKHRALVKITAAFWNRSDIRDLVAGSLTLSDPFYAEEWQEIEDKVMGMVPKLPLPALLIKEILILAQRMGLEVKKWKEYHGHHSKHLGTDIPAEIFWAPHGNVDQKRTAEVLVKDERVDITTRYRLACHYCLEDDIKELWNSIPERKKDDIYDDENNFFEDYMLTVWWACYLTDSTKLYDFTKEIAGREVSPYQFQFECAAEYAIKAQTEYFLQKLTPMERDESLVKCATNLAQKHLFFGISDSDKYEYTVGYDAEMMCFFLSQMDAEQQVKLLKDNPAGVLLCLLDWPWQSFFMETANRVWGVLSEDHYELLLNVMVNRVADGAKNCNYRQLFGEFWQQSPNTYKKYIGGRLTSGLLLTVLFEIEDKKNIRLIFKSFTLAERKEIIFSHQGLDIFQSLIYGNRWDLLKFFIQECVCVSSEDMMFEIEGKLRHIVSSIPEEILAIKNNLLTEFFRFLDDIHDDNGKRCSEERNSNPFKRLKFE